MTEKLSIIATTLCNVAEIGCIIAEILSIDADLNWALILPFWHIPSRLNEVLLIVSNVADKTCDVAETMRHFAK